MSTKNKHILNLHATSELKIHAYTQNKPRSDIVSKVKRGVRGAFFIVSPKKYEDYYTVPNAQSIAILPTYKPTETLVSLVSDILIYSYTTHIIVVNDSSPSEYDAVFDRIRVLSQKRVTVLKTKKNELKAGAINTALRYIRDNKITADAIFTMDDDVQIEARTLGTMVSELLRDSKLGAVCSQARVLNKNKNLLTRLQGLEYLGYNTVRIAESGFFQGPLVMHGMLTAFRYTAIMQAENFATFHLIEDYEMTTRLKKNGWDVKFATDARAWTEVPENFKTLWKQRVRWSVGGIELLAKERYLPAVLQDVIGHFFFIATFISVVMTLSIRGTGSNTGVTLGIAAVAVTQFLISYIFYALRLADYEDKDIWDVLIRLSIIPEFIYANALTFVLLGTYIFFLYCHLLKKVLGIFTFTHTLNTRITSLFLSLGFSQGWGTK